MSRPRRHRSIGDKMALMLRDGARCHICGEGPRPGDPLQVDHVIPLARGGTDAWANKRLAHRFCNQTKGCS